MTLILAVFGMVIVALGTASVYVTWATDSVVLQEGEIADRSYRAPRTETFISELRTEERREEAYNDSRNIVLRDDPSVAPDQISDLNSALEGIDEIRAGEIDDDEIEQIHSLAEGLSDSQADSLLELNEVAWERVRTEAVRLLDEVFEEEISAEDVAGVRDAMPQRSDPQMSASERNLAVALARPYVRANVEVDEEATIEAREEAAADVEPVMMTVQAGQIIVREGDPVTRYHIEQLEYFGLLSPEQTWDQFAGVVGLLSLVTLAMVLYLGKFAPDVCRSRQLLLVALVVAVPLVAGRFVLVNEDLLYMFPAAAAIMLLAILIDFHFAVVVGGFVGLYLGIVSGSMFEIAFVTILAAVAGAAVIWRAERTVTFLFAGLSVGATTFVAASLFHLMEGNLDMPNAGSLLVSSAVNGALSASLTFLFFSLLGTMFGITTHLQLLELAHPNQPLLYRLTREAPGTYHHSIVVSNLAESAAERVGGDPLFARVAVMYHDIGKLMRPTFFIENQANRSNIHDSLDPRSSAQIILDHVADGVRMARKARVPKPIVDVIEQHHGTTLVKYFYNQAVKSGEDVEEADFRYEGPKPQTKEAGIILLADSVEAAVRSMSQSGSLYEETVDEAAGETVKRSQLDRIVDGIIRDRIDDGQLDECDLTIKQIEDIKGIFISILEGVYHPRIEYPESTRTARGQTASDVATAESN
ncbi:MAG: HDIG domain-containing protein [Sphaerobacteraceae bacterium]|nr:MAG: HDIG domain-containing protein [Sphaerobacteraceae bacterium]